MHQCQMQLVMLLVVVPQNAAASICYGWGSSPEAGRGAPAACPLLGSITRSLPSLTEPSIMLSLPQEAATSG